LYNVLTMRLFYILLSFCIFCHNATAQLHDYTWVLGYDGGPISADDDTFGLSILNFNDEVLTITDNQEGEAHFGSNNVNFSNSKGALIYSFTGKGLYDANHELVENGGNWFSGEFSGGWDEPQCGLMFQSKIGRASCRERV